MSDADLSRPLALCSLNFALAEITVTDASGAATMIPGTSAESSIIYEVHTPVELEEHEVRLTKQPYDPYPELRTCATYIVQTKVSPGAISAAKLQARTEEGFKPRCVEVEMVDYALPYEVSIEAALRKDGAAVQAIPNASRPKSRDSRESVTRNLSDAQNDTTWTTGGHIQDPPHTPCRCMLRKLLMLSLSVVVGWPPAPQRMRWSVWAILPGQMKTQTSFTLT